jgi:3D-(3,5/4)-trihydroxycyclohexane-1,2-dione acylhydrolase (decyclizing)
MLPGELVTAVEQELKLTIVLVESGGYKSIGALSRSLGTEGFGTGRELVLDLATNAESLGAHVIRTTTIAELRDALEAAKAEPRTTVISIAVDPLEGVPDYESWWDVAVAEVAEAASVREAREAYVAARGAERRFLGGS